MGEAWLPVDEAGTPRRREYSAPRAAPAENGAWQAPVTGSSIIADVHALIIEDDQTIADFVARGLREAGFAVDEARDGEQGLDAALHQEYDVAIIDLMLPKREGLSVIDELRRRGRATPV